MLTLRRELSFYGQELLRTGLTSAAGGNMSARQGNTVLVSPSGVSLAEISPRDWIAVDLAHGATRRPLRRNVRPTCEITLHLGCYLERQDAQAVMHTHQILATALATAGVSFKALFPDFVAMLGHEVPTIDYVIPAGKGIRDAVTARLKKGANVVILKNHGVLAVGANLKEACFRLQLLEDAARFMHTILSAGKKIRYLSSAQMKAIDRLEAEDYRKLLLKRK